MYLKNAPSLFKTVTFRLTLWYTAVFGGLSLVVFLIVYVSLTSHLTEQTDNDIINKVKEFDALYETHGLEALKAEFQREGQSEGVNNVFFRLLSPNGREIASSDLKPWREFKARHIPPSEVTEVQPVFKTLAPPGFLHSVRTVAKRIANGYIIEIGRTLRANEIMMERYRESFGTALVIMLVCGGFVGWLLARKAMSGVHRVTQTAIRIGKGDLARRVPLGNEGQEINILAYAFNEMLERIEFLIRELRQVTDNVAHELRTPVTRIRGIAETTLNGRGDLGEHREMAASVIEDSDRLIEMINTMLEITGTDAGVAELVSEPLDMRGIVEEASDLFKPLADDKNIGIQLNTPPETVIVRGDRSKLQRVVANLLDNAIKFTPSGGKVTISLENDAALVEMEIADTGIGIDKQEFAHVFERFYRGDKSRSTPGNGLGLSLALAIVRAHGGDINVKSGPGAGSTFTIFLPRT